MQHALGAEPGAVLGDRDMARIVAVEYFPSALATRASTWPRSASPTSRFLPETHEAHQSSLPPGPRPGRDSGARRPLLMPRPRGDRVAARRRPSWPLDVG